MAPAIDSDGEDSRSRGKSGSTRGALALHPSSNFCHLRRAPSFELSSPADFVMNGGGDMGGGGGDKWELVYEGPSTRIRLYRLFDSNSDEGGASVAVKVLADPAPDPRRLQSLYDEYILSRSPSVSKCGAIRAALGHAIIGGNENDGFHAVYLEWAAGTTLREWIRSFHHHGHRRLDDASTMGHLLRLAWRIAGGLSSLHGAGVVHNGISSDNIIVDDAKGIGNGDSDDPHRGGGGTAGGAGCFSVKIIDLGSAALLKENDPSGSVLAKANDLSSLGMLFLELFSGGRRPASLDGDFDCRCERNDADIICEQKSHDGQSASAAPLLRLDDDGQSFRMPHCVASLVSSLMGGGYRSVDEVEMDLHQIMDYPARFLSGGQVARPNETGFGTPLMSTGDRLYGLSGELSTLLDAYSRVARQRSGPGRRARRRAELVVVSGGSGTGKSTLVRRMRDPVMLGDGRGGGGGGLFLSGKFDSLRQLEPLSAIIAAFTDYCEGVVRQHRGGGGGPVEVDRLRAAIMEHAGSEGAALLVELIPGLGPILVGGEPTMMTAAAAGAGVGVAKTHDRFKQVLGAFVRAIGESGGPTHRPVVLFLDDLQWSDTASLDLIGTLVADNENSSLLVVGCYRDNEVDSAHPLSVALQGIENQGAPVTRIKVDNIPNDAMNHLIADTMVAPRSSVKSLTDVIFRKTHGNAFFAVQFLKSLCEEGLLVFSYSSLLWQWNTNAIQSKSFADSAVELMKERILGLPTDMRGVLEVAACLGSHCDEEILRLIADENSGSCGALHFYDGDARNLGASDYCCQMLDVAVSQGLMHKVGTKYQFVHDQIQHAVYILFPKAQRLLLHLQIGKRIWKRSSQAKLMKVLFVAIDQLNLGSVFVDRSDAIEVARLNLQAGKKAMSMSLFLPASEYLMAGMKLLEQLCPSHWHDEYALSLQLYESFAEAEYCNGSFDEMGEVLDAIFRHARCFEDKLCSYSTLVNALGAMDKVQEAIDTAFVVLEQLGEPFPDPGNVEYHRGPELVKTRNMLDEYTDETLLTMQTMVDEQKKAAMEVLFVLIMYTYVAKQKYLPLVTFRMMQLSLRYGVCKESAFAFATYGLLSCGPFGDAKRGYQFGQIALSLLDRFQNKDCMARVYAVVYGCINHWTEDHRLSLKPLMDGYHVGMMFGDIEFAMANARLFCLSSFQCGKNLALLEDEMSAFSKKMIKYKQERILCLAEITRQSVQNLMGRSRDPLRLTGEAMDQDQMLKFAVQNNNLTSVCFAHLHCMWLAYLFGDYESAAQSAENSRNVDKVCTAGHVVSIHAYFDGLTSLALARKTNEEKWRCLADEALKKMKTWAAHASCNLQHKVLLLEAEYAFLEENYGEAGKTYDAAIGLASNNGLVHEQALACERAAIFHLESGDKSKASDYFDQAHDLYLEWGARRKADHLRGRSLSFLTP